MHPLSRIYRAIHPPPPCFTRCRSRICGEVNLLTRSEARSTFICWRCGYRQAGPDAPCHIIGAELRA